MLYQTNILVEQTKRSIYRRRSIYYGYTYINNTNVTLFQSGKYTVGTDTGYSVIHRAGIYKHPPITTHID